MTKFIAFSGKKQTGKNVSADIVRRLLLKRSPTIVEVKNFPFAKPLKDMVVNVFGIPHDLVWGTDEDKETMTHVMWEGFPRDVRAKYATETTREKVYGMPGSVTIQNIPVLRTGPMTIREVLQIMGTDIFRERVYEQVWAEAPFRQPWKESDVVLIPDCRFPNEKEIVEANGGIVIRINRTRPEAMEADTHASETTLDDVPFDLVYQNDGSLEELEDWLAALLVDQGLIR